MLLLLYICKQEWLAAMQTCSNDYNVLLQVTLDARIETDASSYRPENVMIWYMAVDRRMCVCVCYLTEQHEKCDDWKVWNARL